MARTDWVDVFTHQGKGGNPCPVIRDAGGVATHEMQATARRHGHEVVFVLPPPSPSFDFAFRYFVPNHEMEMCGHATIGALWLMASDGELARPQVRVQTASGPVIGWIDSTDQAAPSIAITQPGGRVTRLARTDEDGVLAALGLDRSALLDAPIQNAATARVKTLVPLRDLQQLHALAIHSAAIEDICVRIGSTGLYPYAIADVGAGVYEARQFPRSSGYPEDPATGIAATALAFGLLATGQASPQRPSIRVLQGRAMARLSEIRVRVEFSGTEPTGCLLSGSVGRA